MTFSPIAAPTTPLIVLLQRAFEDKQPSVLGVICGAEWETPAFELVEVCGFSRQEDPSQFVSSDFRHIMDRIRVHLEGNVTRAGSLSWQDFANVFGDVPPGEGRVAVYRALEIWYRTIYIRHSYEESKWRDMYADKSRLTKQQELGFFENMRTADGGRWRDLFISRNMGLVGWAMKFYTGKLDGGDYNNSWGDDRKLEREFLLAAGRKGLELAVDKVKSTEGPLLQGESRWALNNRFSTMAVRWIKGEITAAFKRSKSELRAKPRLQAYNSRHVRR
jgi:hypothetical protein